jgi:hypothetical protein
VSNIYNNNKASNAKIGQNVNKAVYFFARFFRVNLVVCFNIKMTAGHGVSVTGFFEEYIVFQTSETTFS